MVFHSGEAREAIRFIVILTDEEPSFLLHTKDMKTGTLNGNSQAVGDIQG